MKTSSAPEKGFLAPAAHLAAALVSGSILAFELFVMRVFAIGGWSHFGSTVICIAMLGFGVFSTVLCIWKETFKQRLVFWIGCSLLLLGPSMMIANTLAQRIPFNPIFLISDPSQKFYLAGYFLLYFVPFLLGAMFLGLFFVLGQREFGKAYFANMTGSGIGGIALFAGMYFVPPEKLFVVPLLLWIWGASLWFLILRRTKLIPLLAASALLSLLVGFHFVQIDVSPYKGVSYAGKLPDAQKVCQGVSPFGSVEVYSSSYFHFAPGLSDATTLYLDTMPENAYLGMYIDGDGPIGIMKDLPASQAEYFKFLPMSMPYLLKAEPDVLVMQFGGGISTNVALKLGAKSVTVAEGNPAVVQTVRDNDFISRFTGHVLENPSLKLIPNDGRIFVRQAKESFDIVDLSLADSTGLSMPGGSSIQEKFAYTEEAFHSCMESLRSRGILSVTVWNKEDPPKSTLKLVSTLVRAARDAGSKELSRDFFMAHTYLSTFTVLYKKGGFDDEDVRKLEEYCRKMSFETVYLPGQERPSGDIDKILAVYRNTYFAPQENEVLGDDLDVSVGNLYRLAVDRLIAGDANSIVNGYPFNIESLTNDRPYFAGFVKPRDIPKFLDQLESISDEWGYLLLWATLFLAMFWGSLLMLLPLLFGWKAFFSKDRGKLSIITYFICLGIGYILVEISMISECTLCLGNPTVSFTALVTGMLLFSGLGSYASQKLLPYATRAMIVICSSIAAILVVYAFSLNQILSFISMWPYWVKILSCLLILFPLAFLLGFPFALGMSTLANRKKEHFFVWAWGINGSFSVVGSVMVPILSILLGISSVMIICAVIYLIAAPCFLRFQAAGN